MRSADGVFLIEGPVLVAEAIEAGAEIEGLYVEEASAGDPVVRSADVAGIACHVVRDGALTKVLDQRSPRPMAAVAAQRFAAADRLVLSAAERSRPLLVVVDLADPGNAGTLIRVAEASGCVGFLAVGHSVDVHNPKTVRASAGSLFRLPVAHVDETATVATMLRAGGVRSVGATGHAVADPRHGGTGPSAADPSDLDAADLDGAFALLIGNEAHGLGGEVLAGCDARVCIPMEGAVESLNAAVAGAVVLFEAARRRRRAESRGGGPPTLGQNEARPGTKTEDPPDV